MGEVAKDAGDGESGDGGNFINTETLRHRGWRREYYVAICVGYWRCKGTWIAVLGLAVLMAGCDLFSTREPASPTSNGSNFESPTSPSIVLRNMENALAGANAGDYRKCFSDSSRGLPPFRFRASSQGIAAAPSTFDEWGIDQEEKYVRNIFAELQSGASCTVTFNPSEVTDVPIGDSIQFSATYLVKFPHTRQGAEREAEGQLQFTFRLSRQNEWYISTWHDVALAGKTSWSLIKARFID